MPEPTTILLIVAVLLLAALLVLMLVLLRRRPDTAAPTESLQLLQNQMTSAQTQQDERLKHLTDSLNKQLAHGQDFSLKSQEQLQATLKQLNETVNQQLTRGHALSQQAQKLIQKELSETGKTVGQLKGQLGQLTEATQSILRVGSEVRQLQDILQSPKLRGGLGEWTLDNLLADVLPAQHYRLQHRFANGTIVDALVTLAQGHVCIDAKFPLSNFRAMLEEEDDTARERLRRAFYKDVHKRIDEIADKYILPDEGTLDFALMFVPAENVYYEAICGAGSDVAAYGRQRKVIPVGPNTLYAYLMVVATGLKGLQIEKNAQAIREQLTRLTGDLGNFENDFILVGKHLANAQSKQTDAAQKLQRFQTRIEQLEGQQPTDQ